MKNCSLIYYIYIFYIKYFVINWNYDYICYIKVNARQWIFLKKGVGTVGAS